MIQVLNYPNSHKAVDSIESIPITVFHNDQLRIAYYDWYGDIKINDVISFVENSLGVKFVTSDHSDGNGHVGFTAKIVKDQ